VHAIRLHAFGPPEQLRHEDVPDPAPAPGEVRIAVEAAGVHLIDTVIRGGVARGPIPLPSLPAIPGREVAGRVDAVGDGVDATWVGRRVVAHFGPRGAGGYAERATVAVERVHALDEDGRDRLSAEVAVTAIGTGRTAQLILDAAAIGPQDRVLVPAAAGGMGPLLAQAARAAGAEVIAVAGGPEKVARAETFGPTLALDHRAPGWEREAGSVTVVLDSVGGAFGAAAQELLAPGGRVVVIGVPPTSARDDVTAIPLVPPPDVRPLETRALDAFATGALRPNLHPAFGLRDAAAAHAALEARATMGKVVLKP
jgi:NADPH2:quinone reductase